MSYIYSDIQAQLYDHWFGKEPFEDQAFYQYFIEQKKGTALEIGAGTGRLLLPYIRDGLNVEGIDPSETMIRICYEKAQKLGLEPTIYQQAMENLSLEKKYSTIYIPLCSFQLITELKNSVNTLKLFHDHLENKGQLIISLFVPQDDPCQENCWRIRRSLEKDGKQIILSEALRNNRFEQIQTQKLKYEFYNGTQLEKSYLFEVFLRWYHKFEFLSLLTQAGFQEIEIYSDYTFEEADENSQVFVWRALKK